jgi:hypothetical protein
VNPFVLSAIGLEVLLIPALLILLLATALEGRAGWFGVVSGLAMLARLDLIVFVLLMGVATPAVRREWRAALGAVALVAGPWFVFSWFYLGSAVPDTLLIKVSQGGFGIWNYVTGPVMYYTERQIASALALLPAVLGLFALSGWLVARTSVRWTAADALPPLGPAAALGAGGVAYYAVYSVLGVPPYHWYYVAPIASLSMFLVIAVGVWMTHARERRQLRPAVPALGLGVAAVLAVGNLAVDVEQGVPWKSPVMFTNWATADDYARVARGLRDRVGTAAVESPGEIGTLAYHCECAITDEFSDRGYFVRRVNHDIATSGLARRALLRLNFVWLDRDQEPRPLSYRLVYAEGPAKGPDVWQVDSTWRGAGHFTLVPAPRQ